MSNWCIDHFLKPKTFQLDKVNTRCYQVWHIGLQGTGCKCRWLLEPNCRLRIAYICPESDLSNSRLGKWCML